MQELKVLTSGPLSSSAPDCLSSSLKEYTASLGAVVLGSQSAIPVEVHVGVSIPVGQLPRAFLLDRMLDQWLHGRKSRERFLRPFHSAFKAASHLQDDASVSFTRGVHGQNVPLSTSVDTPPPFSGPPDPSSWLAIKQGVGGVSPPRVPRDTPSLVTDG